MGAMGGRVRSLGVVVSRGHAGGKVDVDGLGERRV